MSTFRYQNIEIEQNWPNPSFKDKFGNWYASEVTKQLDEGAYIYAVGVELQLSVLKPVQARQLISVYGYFRNQPELTIKGFEQAGISDAIHIEIESEDPFKDLF